MSLSYTGMKPLRLIDPRVNITEAKNYLFKQGANVVTYRTYTSTSSNDSSCSFKCNPPNPDIAISRLVFIACRATFDIFASYRNTAGDDGAPNDILNLSGLVSGNTAAALGLNAICPRQFPLESIMRSLKVNINSDTLTVQPYHYIHALGKYNLDETDRAYQMSASPVQPDCYQKYADAGVSQEYVQTNNNVANNPLAGSQGLGYGAIRSPFANYGDTTLEVPRGAYKPISVAYTEAEKKTTIVYEFTTPLIISPLVAGKYDSMGLSQVSTMDVDISWDSSKLARMLSIDNSIIQTVPASNAGDGIKANSRKIENIRVTMGQASDMKISFIYLTPQVNRPKPESIVYDYHDLYVYNKNIESIDAGADRANIQSDNMSLGSIPNRVYIYMKLKEGLTSPYTSDTFARIKKIDVNFNGVSGVLSSAQEWDLWRMSASNGLKMAYPEWQNYTGSVLCIDFGKNLGLGPQQCVGLLGTFDFSYQLTAQNIDTVAKEYDLYTVIDYAGTFTITNGQVVKQIGVVSTRDVLESGDYKDISGEYLEKLYGGSFMTGLKHIYGKAQQLKPYAKKGIQIAKDLAPILETVAPRAAPFLNKGLDIASQLVGQGYSKAEINKMKKMGYTEKDLKKLLGGNMVAGNIFGGAVLPKQKLQQRLARN